MRTRSFSSSANQGVQGQRWGLLHTPGGLSLVIMFNETRELTWSTKSVPSCRQSFRLKTDWTEPRQSRKSTHPSYDLPQCHRHTSHIHGLLAFHLPVPMTLVHLELNLYPKRRKGMRTGLLSTP